MPNVVRLPEAQARSIIEAAGLQNTYTNYQELKDVEPGNRAHFNSIPVGAVVSQNPTAGQMVAVGTRVHIAVRKPD